MLLSCILSYCIITPDTYLNPKELVYRLNSLRIFSPLMNEKYIISKESCFIKSMGCWISKKLWDIKYIKPNKNVRHQNDEEWGWRSVAYKENIALILNII